MSARAMLAIAAAAMLVGGGAHAQSQPTMPPPAKKACVNQYSEAPGITPAKLLRDGYEIRAGWPGGLWFQKGKDAYFCNSGRALEGALLCWTLQDPKGGAACDP
jgi:hypothetical protein